MLMVTMNMDCSSKSTVEPLSTEASADNSGSAEENAGRGCRHKRKQSLPIFCPVCSVTLRPTELESHLDAETSKLDKINWKSKCPANNHSHNNHNHHHNRASSSPSSQHTAVNGGSALANSDKETVKCWETFQKVKTNRESRLKMKSRKRKNDQAICPICNLETTVEEINIHVEMCLRKSGDVESDVDVEDVDDKFEEYEWAGQSRVRASSLLEGGYAAVGIGTSISSSAEDDNADLVVVDGDDNDVYGSPQYTERDIMMLDGENTALREAIIAGCGTTTSTNTSNSTATIETTTSNKKKKKNGENSSKHEQEPPSSVQTATADPIIEALKNRIRELERKELSKDVHKCLICMEKYQTPVISVCCWHVHCESCWLQTLAAKKLCPQCNMITSPADLRRIYI